MKKAKLTLILAATSLLASCGVKEGPPSSNEGSSNASDDTSSVSSTNSKNSSTSSNNDSSSSSSSKEDGTVSFTAMYSEIDNVESMEISNASSTTFKDEYTTSALSHILNETYTSYSDGSTSSIGTYTKAEDGKETKTDPFKRIATKVTDKYGSENGSTITSYPMFVQVTDFENDIGTSSAYQDSVSKKFIIDSENDKGNLSDDEYILASNFGKEASAKLTEKLKTIISEIGSSNYISQLGKGGIKPITNADGNIEYNDTFRYSYDDEGYNTNVVIHLDYVLDAEKTKLLSFDFSNTTTLTREEDGDTYFQTYAQSGSIVYGERATAKDEGVLNPNDYFLATVNAVGLEAKKGFNVEDKGHEEGIDISREYTKIYGYAALREPEKSLKQYLTPVSSSDTNVVNIDDDGDFSIVGAGTVDLTFSYYHKGSDDVYRLETIKYGNLTISEILATSIIFGSYGDNRENGFVAGTTYSWSYYVSPSKASQAATAVSSDPSVLEVEVTSNGTLSLKALKAGTADITLTSDAEPHVQKTKTFTVIEGETDYTSFLTGNTFCSDRTMYGYYIYLAFKTDGTGTCVTTLPSGLEPITTDFTWTLKGTKITFPEYEKNGKILTAANIGYVSNKETGEKSLGFIADGDGDATLEFYVTSKKISDLQN